MLFNLSLSGTGLISFPANSLLARLSHVLFQHVLNIFGIAIFFFVRLVAIVLRMRQSQISPV